MQNTNLIAPSNKSQPVSLREKSTSDLTAAIRSPNDAGKVLRRLSVSYSMFYEPDHDPVIKAAAMQAFCVAVSDLPTWAVLKAFADWDKIGAHRPTPVKIRELAEAALRPLQTEILRRQLAEKSAASAAPVDRGPPVTAEAAARIIKEVWGGDDMAVEPKRFGGSSADE